MVEVALDDQDRAPHLRADRLDFLDCKRELRVTFQQEGLDATVEPVGDRVLDLLRRVRLGKHLREPELHEVAEVLLDVVAVVLGPTFVLFELLFVRRQCCEAVGKRRRKLRNSRRQGDDAEHPVGVGGRKLDGRPHAVGALADQDRRLRIGLVHHPHAVVDPRVDRPLSRGVWVVRVAVAYAVVRDDAIVARQVMDLPLPHARVADGRARQKNEGLRAVAENLVVETQAVGPGYVAALVGYSGSHPGVGVWHLGTPYLS